MKIVSMYINSNSNKVICLHLKLGHCIIIYTYKK